MKLGYFGCAVPFGLSIIISELFTNSSNAFQKSSLYVSISSPRQLPICWDNYNTAKHRNQRQIAVHSVYSVRQYPMVCIIIAYQIMIAI